MQLLSDLPPEDTVLAAAIIDAELNEEQRQKVIKLCKDRGHVHPDGSCFAVGFVLAARKVLGREEEPFY